MFKAPLPRLNQDSIKKRYAVNKHYASILRYKKNLYRAMLIASILSLLMLNMAAVASPYKHEGILGSPTENIRNLNAYVNAFIPYNPTIVEIGAFEGLGTVGLAQSFPYGRIFALEPNPKAFQTLVQNTQSLKNVKAFNFAINNYSGMVRLWVNDENSSLLPLDRCHCISVPCLTLDHWCSHNNIAKIDFLRLDAGGAEWKIVQNSKILNSVYVIAIKTHLKPSCRSILSFKTLKQVLEGAGFELLCHHYKENEMGEATFVRKPLFDSIFR